MQIQHAAGVYNNLVNSTDYTVTTATSGVPVITYTDSTTSNLVYNENTLLLSEAYRRLYPVIHDTSNIFLVEAIQVGIYQVIVIQLIYVLIIIVQINHILILLEIYI